MTPKAPKETAEQKQVRMRAESENIRSLQSTVQQRTSIFQRLRSPRVSIATGRSSSAIPLWR